MTGPGPCWPSLRYLTRLGLTNPVPFDPAAAAAPDATFLVLGPAAAAPFALRFGAELIAVRLRLRLGTIGAFVVLLVTALTAAELQMSLEKPATVVAVVLPTAGTALVVQMLLHGVSRTCKRLER